MSLHKKEKLEVFHDLHQPSQNAAIFYMIAENKIINPVKLSYGWKFTEDVSMTLPKYCSQWFQVHF